MKLKIIWGFITNEGCSELNIIDDYAALLDEYNYEYEKVLGGLEEEGFEYFRTYNPLYPNYLNDGVALENVLIWNGTRLKKFNEFPELCHKLKVMGPGEALCDTDFSKEWKQ